MATKVFGSDVVKRTDLIYERDRVSSNNASSFTISQPEMRPLESLHRKYLVPGEFQLGTLCDGRFRVASPIYVHLTSEKNQVVAEATELNEFGFGETLSEAIRDLQESIVQLYTSLDSDSNRLGPDLTAVWEILSRKVIAREE